MNLWNYLSSLKWNKSKPDPVGDRLHAEYFPIISYEPDDHPSSCMASIHDDIGNLMGYWEHTSEIPEGTVIFSRDGIPLHIEYAIWKDEWSVAPLEPNPELFKKAISNLELWDHAQESRWRPVGFKGTVIFDHNGEASHGWLAKKKITRLELQFTSSLLADNLRFCLENFPPVDYIAYHGSGNYEMSRDWTILETKGLDLNAIPEQYEHFWTFHGFRGEPRLCEVWNEDFLIFHNGFRENPHAVWEFYDYHMVEFILITQSDELRLDKKLIKKKYKG
jgi:hypothetical protein